MSEKEEVRQGIIEVDKKCDIRKKVIDNKSNEKKMFIKHQLPTFFIYEEGNLQ